MSDEIKKLEQKLQQKIKKSIPINQSQTSIKPKNIDADHIKRLAHKIQKGFTDQDHAAFNR